MLKECICVVCGTLIVSVTADIFDMESTNSSSNWFDDLMIFFDINKYYQTWILSIIASCMIGLSGILPLIIIPFENGAKFDQKGMYMYFFLSEVKWEYLWLLLV